MELTLKDLENMGVQAIADNPSELISHINKLGKNTISQNQYISKIVSWLYAHKDDEYNNNMPLELFIDDWFDDRDAHTIQHVLEDKHTDKNTKNEMKNISKQGYTWVYDRFNTKVCPVGFKEVTTLLWNMNEKLEAYEELND